MSILTTGTSWDQIFTDVFLLTATDLVVPFSLCCQRERDAALSLPSGRLSPGSIPVEESDRQAVHVHILAFLHYVCYADPEVFGCGWAAFDIVCELVVLADVSRYGQGPSLCDAVLVGLVVVLDLLRKQVTLPVGFDATQANWNIKTPSLEHCFIAVSHMPYNVNIK